MSHNKPTNLHPHKISIDGYDMDLQITKVPVKKKGPKAPPADGRRCQHIMKSGDRCKALKMHGNTNCYFHAPELKDARIENSRKAGKRTRILPMELASPVLESAEDVRQFAIEVMHQVRTGQIDVRTAQVMNQLLTHVMKTLPDGNAGRLSTSDRLRMLLSEDECVEVEEVGEALQSDRSSDWEDHPVQAV